MDEPFVISVNCKGTERNFEAQLFTFRYTYRIQVWIEDVAFYFERDDEGSFRGVTLDFGDTRVQNIDAD